MSDKNALLEAFIFRIEKQRRYSKYTSRNYKKAVADWLGWLNLNEFAKGDFINVDKRIARNYVMELSRNHSESTVHNKISAIRSFYKFLIQIQETEFNPFSTVRLPKLKKSLPIFLSESQTPNLLQTPTILARQSKISREDAIRDTACLELLYGAGLRVSELCNLKWSDVDLSRNIATITGKGNKTRIVPFGKNAGDALKKYHQEVPQKSNNPDTIFFSPHGKPLYPRLVQLQMKKYLKIAGLPLDITPHKLRHSFATHLVNADTDLRALQEMMGHASLSTTQIYSHLSTRKLVQTHRQTHPRSNKNA